MQDAHVLTGLAPSQLFVVTRWLRRRPVGRGRPWALSLERRVLIGCTSLRSNLTVRELAVMFEISRSQAHRIVVDISARIADLLSPRNRSRPPVVVDRRWNAGPDP